MAAGTLYLGDNLDVLRDDECIQTESVDLIYLDPPFNSRRDYNMLFAEQDMSASRAQLRAFEDSWRWDSVAQGTYESLIAPVPEQSAAPAVKNIVEAFCRAFPRSDMAAYLVMMAVRLVELHRVLKPIGSLYLHCDPTASHYLKMLLDAIFGPSAFRNEIIWKRTTAHSSARKYAPVHDVLLYYAKTNETCWNSPRTAYDPAYLDKYYRFDDGDGRLYWRDNLCAAGVRHGRSGLPWHGIDPSKKGMHWKFTIDKLDQLDKEGRIYWPERGTMPQYKRYREELKGLAVSDIWDDVDRINPVGSERVGYPTQKPLALLERIIMASSNEGDVVLDPFCGCGTTIHAAQRLKRTWIGIDITFLAIRVIENRLKMSFPDLEYAFDGIPKDTEGALALAERSPHNFQEWAVHALGADQTGGRRAKRGGDGGIDGTLRFATAPGMIENAIIQVTGEKNVGPKKVRDLAGTLLQEKAPMGVLFTAYPATRGMKDAAAASGTVAFDGWKQRYPRIQLVSADEWFQGKRIEFPGRVLTTPEVEPPGSRVGENLVLKGIEAPRPPPRRAAIVSLAREPVAEQPKRAMPARPSKRVRSDHR